MSSIYNNLKSFKNILYNIYLFKHYIYHTAIDGGWGAWESWSKCSVACGTGGESHRSRVCNEPKPMHGGKSCLGKKVEERSCAEKPCRMFYLIIIFCFLPLYMLLY